MNKENKRSKKNDNEEEFTPYFTFLDEIKERKEFIQKIYEINQSKRDFKIVYKTVNTDEIDGLPYLVEDIKCLIEINFDKGYVSYPVYSQFDIYPVYKKSLYLPPNGIKSVKVKVQRMALGIVMIVLKEVTTVVNESDVRHTRDIDGEKIEDYFLYDFETKKWNQTDKNNPELKDRLIRIKRLDVIFDEIFSSYYAKCKEFDGNILENKTYGEFYDGLFTLAELLKSSRLVLYGFLHNGTINDYQFNFLRGKLDDLSDSIKNIMEEYAVRKKIYDKLVDKPHEKYTINTPINNPAYKGEYSERYDTKLRIEVSNLQTNFINMFGKQALSTAMEKFLMNMDEFEKSIDIEDYEKICYYEGNSTAEEFVPRFSYINFKLGRVKIAMKKDDFNRFISIIESPFIPEKEVEIEDEDENVEEIDEKIENYAVMNI